MSHSAPFVRIEETDAPADEKIWNINSTAGTLAISTATDLNATINDAILMSRTGTTVDDITLTATELTIAARPTISSVTPEIRVTETDAPTLNQNWSLNFSSGSLVARLYDDSFSASTDFFSVTRSGLTASSITLDAAEINLNSTSGEVVIQSTAPKLRLFDDDEAGTDQKNWMIRSLSSSLAITTYTDGIAPVSNAMLFERTGTVVDKITLTATEVDIVGNLLVNGVAQPTITQGTWTPELWDASSSNAEGQAYGTRNGAWYQKHGEVVTIWGQLQMTALGTLTTSDVAVIGGIPFTSSATLDNGGGVSMTLATGLAITSGTTVSGRIQGSSANRIVLYVWDGTFGPSNMLISEITSDGALYFWGQYTTDA